MKNKLISFGAGLLALDVILNGNPSTLPKLSAGGSCGNVLSILGYMKWNSYPVARLDNNIAAEELLKDLCRWNIHTDFISKDDGGSTPIIIHRITKDKFQKPIHRFEFRDPETKSWLPQFKAITKSFASEIINKDMLPQVFYFDRMNPGTYDLAVYLRSKGSVIFFEPNSMKDAKQFEKFLKISDIVKFSHDRLPNYKNQYPKSTCFLEIETRGKEGLSFRFQGSKNRDVWNIVDPYLLDDIQDAAGAGDWCSAGIIFKLCSSGSDDFKNSSNSKILEALKFGQALGAFNCKFDGARGAMYNMDLDELFLIINTIIETAVINPLYPATNSKIDISLNIKLSDLYQPLKTLSRSSC